MTKTPWRLEWHINNNRLFITGSDELGSVVCEIRLHDRAEAVANVKKKSRAKGIDNA